MWSGRQGHWLKLATAWLPVLTVAIGALWGLYKYLDDQRAARANAEALQRTQNQTREVEAQRPFLSKKLEVFFETARVAGVLASVPPANPEWKDARSRLLSLRWSELQIVGTAPTRARMREVISKLYEFEDAFERDPRASATADKGYSLQRGIECLADELRHSVEVDWSGMKQTASGTARSTDIGAPCE